TRAAIASVRNSGVTRNRAASRIVLSVAKRCPTRPLLRPARRGLQEAAGLLVPPQQSLDAGAQAGVGGAGPVQEGGPPARAPLLQRLDEDRLLVHGGRSHAEGLRFYPSMRRFAPTCARRPQKSGAGRRHSSPPPSSSSRSQARAEAQL